MHIATDSEVIKKTDLSETRTPYNTGIMRRDFTCILKANFILPLISRLPFENNMSSVLFPFMFRV